MIIEILKRNSRARIEISLNLRHRGRYSVNLHFKRSTITSIKHVLLEDSYKADGTNMWFQAIKQFSEVDHYFSPSYFQSANLQISRFVHLLR